MRDSLALYTVTGGRTDTSRLRLLNSLTVSRYGEAEHRRHLDVRQPQVPQQPVDGEAARARDARPPEPDRSIGDEPVNSLDSASIEL